MASSSAHLPWFGASPIHPLAVILMLSCLAALSYANTFSSSFHFDDRGTILENPSVKQFGTDDVWQSRAVGTLTFALNYRFGRFSVWGYHVVNLLIHITNACLVYTLARLLLRTPGLSWPNPSQPSGVPLVAALLFVAHPIQTQAVTYIAQRFTGLATLFYLLAVVCYLRWRLATPTRPAGRIWYGAALGATLLAMLSKEIAFTLPFMLLIVEWLCFRPASWRRRWTQLLPFFLTLPVIPLILHGHLADMTRETQDISRLTYLMTQFRVMVTYLRLLIIPVNQSVDYDYPLHHSLTDPAVLLSLCLLLALGLGAIYALCCAPRWRLAGFGMVWFFVTLSVESSVIPIRDVLVEHRLYLPSVGFFVAVGAVAGILVGHWRPLSIIAAGLVIASLASAAYHRNAVWKDEITLWSDAVAKNPANARAHTSLGAAYSVERRFAEAIAEHRTALRLKPDYAEARNLLGLTYAKQGQLEEAAKELEAAVQLRPDFADARNNLAKVYAGQHQFAEATTEFLSAIQLRPDFADAHYNLGSVYLRLDRLGDAQMEFIIAVQLDPDLPEAHHGLGLIYAQQGNADAAIPEYLAALRLRPSFAEAHADLGTAYRMSGHLEEARRHYEQALQLRPSLTRAQQGLLSIQGL